MRAGLRLSFHLAAALLSFAVAVPGAEAAQICTLVADRNGVPVLTEGDCARRVTPASTFKIALAVMGYDAGVLDDARNPVMPPRAGDPDWGGAAWRSPTGPEAWMRHSVVWYSQRITHALGTERVSRYLVDFKYGNADFSGDPGRGNALERAWISSSLTIAPLEQARFLAALLNGTLPVRAGALERAASIVETWQVAGWTIHGKTGTAFPRRADGQFDRARGWGWFVGWAERDGRRVIFVRLMQDEERHRVSGGLRARDALLADWAELMERLPR